jgi:hypothetical protein
LLEVYKSTISSKFSVQVALARVARDSLISHVRYEINSHQPPNTSLFLPKAIPTTRAPRHHCGVSPAARPNGTQAPKSPTKTATQCGHPNEQHQCDLPGFEARTKPAHGAGPVRGSDRIPARNRRSTTHRSCPRRTQMCSWYPGEHTRSHVQTRVAVMKRNTTMASFSPAGERSRASPTLSLSLCLVHLDG